MKVIDQLTQEYFYGAFQKLLERYNKCIAAGGDYFEDDLSFMCVLSIMCSCEKSLETYLMILVYILPYTHTHIYIILSTDFEDSLSKSVLNIHTSWKVFYTVSSDCTMLMHIRPCCRDNTGTSID